MAVRIFRCSQVNHFRLRSIKRSSGCADQVGHLQRWPCHLFRGERERVQRAGRGPHMALRQMDVNHRFAQVGVAEQQLDGAQVGAGFEQMCGEAVAKSVRDAAAY